MMCTNHPDALALYAVSGGKNLCEACCVRLGLIVPLETAEPFAALRERAVNAARALDVYRASDKTYADHERWLDAVQWLTALCSDPACVLEVLDALSSTRELLTQQKAFTDNWVARFDAIVSYRNRLEQVNTVLRAENAELRARVAVEASPAEPQGIREGATESAACVCGHSHSVVSQDGVLSVFHRCRAIDVITGPCRCNEFVALTAREKPLTQHETDLIVDTWRKAEAHFLAAAEGLQSQLDAAQRDTALIDWMDTRREAIVDVRTTYRQISDDEAIPEQEEELLGYRWDGVHGQCESIRDAIDAERDSTAGTPVCLTDGAHGEATGTSPKCPEEHCLHWKAERERWVCCFCQHEKTMEESR